MDYPKDNPQKITSTDEHHQAYHVNMGNFDPNCSLCDRDYGFYLDWVHEQIENGDKAEVL